MPRREVSSVSNFVRFALQLHLVEPRHLHILGASGRERMSEPYRFEIQVATPISEDRMQALTLGQAARLTIAAGRRHRHVHGVIRSIRTLGVHPRFPSLLCYRVVLAPRLWLLSREKTSRIFQDKTVREV